MDFSSNNWKMAVNDCRSRNKSLTDRLNCVVRTGFIFGAVLALLFIVILIPSGHALTNDSVTITVTCNPSPILYGSSTQCTVTLTDTAPTPNNGPPQGTVAFTVSPTGGAFSPSNTCTLSTSGAESSTCSVTYSPSSSGSKTITGTYTRSNNSWIGGGTGSTTLSVVGRTTSTSVSCSPSTLLAGTGTTCTVTVTDTSSGTAITPTGTVSMSSSRSGTFTTCSLSGNGATATCTSTYTPGSGSEGSITVTASYPGDAPHSGSSGTDSVTATIRDSLTSLLCTPFPDAVGAPATCTVTISDSSPGTTFTPTGAVTFSDSPVSSGTFSSTTCTLSGGSCTVTYTPGLGNEGSIGISAVYSGDTDHTGSSSTFSLQAVERSTSTTITCNSTEVLLNQVATCTATVADTSGGTKITPTMTLTFQDNPASSGVFSATSCNPTGSGGTASCAVTYQPTSLGLHTLFANYTGEPDLSLSSGSIAMNSYDFTITVTQGSVALRGTSVTYTVTLKLVPGSTGTIPADVLTVLGLPSDATFSFSPTSKVPTSGGANSTLTVNTQSGSTGSLGDFSLTVVGSDPSASGGSHSANSTLGIYDYSITVSPSSEAILRGDQANYNVTISLSSGSTTTGLPSTILLSLTGAPTSSTVTLASPVPFPFDSSAPTVTLLTIATSGSTPGGTFTLTVTGNVGTGSHTGTATLTVVAPSITLNPVTGIVGVTVIVSGSNFAPSSNITITYGSSTVANATADVSGLFSASFVVPASVYGPHTVTATDSFHSGQATFTVTPSIALNPANGVGGTSVSVTGTGFGASSTVTIRYDGTTQPTSPTTITTSSLGSFTATFTVPGSSTNGAHTVTATDSSSHSATATFSIIASITLNPSSGLVGSTVTVTGTGFAASSTITVKYDGTTVTTTPATVTSSTAGSFSASFIIPASTNGPHTVTTTDAASHTATKTFTVVASITLSPATGPSGISFTITGSGFSGSSSITITFDTTSIASSSTGITGAFSTSATVPTSTIGPHTVTATDAFSHSASATFTISPGISLNPTSGAVSSPVTVSGTSFSPNSTVTITFGSLTVATVTSDGLGLFTALFNVPASTFGPHTVTATDASAHSATATFSVTASITLSPTSGPTATTVTVSGTGFAASSTITIKYDGVTQTTSPTTVASSTIGSFSATFAVPTSTNGGHTVTATDVSAHSASASFTVTASITLSPASSIVGATVTVSGTGFAASSTITVKYDGVTQTTSPGTITSSTTGTFSATFTVPSSSLGSHTVTATDALGNTASTTFTLLASVVEQITISVASGVPTASGILNGCSVNPGTIAFDGNQHIFAALPSCTITITVPTDGSNTRFRFAGPSTTATTNTCASGTCPSTVITVYYQLLNTYTATPTTPTTWDAPLSITVTGTIAGQAPRTGCVINALSGGGSVSCQGWFDYNAPVTVTSPVVLSASEQWLTTTTNTFTDITAGLTHTVSYTDQFQVSLAASPNTGGTTTPSGTTGWLNYGSTVSITETPNTGFTFTVWTSSSTLITFTPSASANPVTATVTGGGTITANFVKGLDCFASAANSSPSSTISVVLTNCRGNDVIIVVITQDLGSPATSMSDTAGLTYARRFSDTQGNNQIVEEWWARVGAANITIDTITATGVNGGGNHHTDIIAVGFSGIAPGFPFDPNAGLPRSNPLPNGQPTVTGVTTSNANDILVAMVGSQGPNSDTSGGALFLVTSRFQAGEVASFEYGTLGSTLSGATITFDTSTTSQTKWVMVVDALLRVAAQSAQPVTITTLDTNVNAVISVSGCNVVPATILADGSQVTLAADASCTLTFTVPSDTASTRYRFNNAGTPSTTWTLVVNCTGTCAPASNNVYYQQLQTLSYSITGGGSPIPPVFRSTGLNSTTSQTLTTIATGYWFDNGVVWSVTDPIAGGTGEKWQIDTGSQADTGTISSGQTIVFVYVHQYFLTVTSAQDTPTPVSGWFNAGSSITEAVTSPVAGATGVQHVTAGWTGTGSVPTTGGSSSVTFTINAASSITWNWQTQYLLTVQTTGLQSSHPTAVYLNGASSGTASDTAPFTAWLNSGSSTGTIGVDNTINGGPGTGYFFTSWSDSSTSNPRSSVTVSAPLTFTADFGTDTSPPVITPSETPTPNINGWNNVSVTISWTEVDPESNVASSSGCGTVTLTSETSSTTVTCTAANRAGLTGSASLVVKIDETRPVVTGLASPSPNSNGWNNGDLTVTFSCTDSLSGVAIGPVTPQLVSSEGSGQSRSATCTDNAGNTGSGTVSGIKIDKTAPAISSSRSPAANSNGWNNVAVTVSFTCTDALSGVSSSPPPTTLGEGAGQSVTGVCLDNAGNSASSSQTGINIDMTSPSIIGSASPSPNANGWNNGNVTISYTCNDALSGVDIPSSPSIISSEGSSQSASGSCTDKAGNTSSATVGGINIDKTAPLITSSRSPGANTNGWNNVTVTVSFTCTDALSGVFSTPSNSNLGEGGGQSVTGTCIDNAGNSASSSQTNISVDLTQPIITSSRSVPPNSNGWNNGPVTVSFTCNDALSGVSAVTSSTTLGEGANQSVPGACVDLAGNSASTTETGVSIDNTLPTISGSRSPGANSFGWNNASVTVSFTCNDSLSGVASSSSPTVVDLEGVQSVTGTCVDNAGNLASSTVGSIQIDLTPPTIATARSVPPNSNGWNNVPVTVSFSCADGLSGVNTGSTPTTLGEGQGQSVTGICTDRAGNSASVTEANVNIDLTLPTITGSLLRPPNANGWTNSSDPVVFTCSDSLSGVAFCNPPSTPTSEGSGQSVTGFATDLAGNNATMVVSNINIDKTLPVLTASRTSPNAFGWNSGPVIISFTCSDPLSGVDSYSTPITVQGESKSQSVTGNCSDKAGNIASLTVGQINIDLTLPAITWSRSPPDFFGGTFGPVTVTFSCNDALSGVANVASPVTLGNGQGQSVTGTCVDEAGNQTFVVAGPINVGLNTSLLLLVLLIVASALSTFFLVMYRRRRRNKFIWDLQSAQGAEDPLPKGAATTEGTTEGPS